MLYRGLFEGEGLSLPLRPFIFTPHEAPLVIEVELARANPALAVFLGDLPRRRRGRG